MDQSIANWFGNNTPKKDDSSEVAPKAKHTRDFTIRDIVKTLHKDKIHGLIAKETQASVGHKDWLRHYPSAVNKVIEGLTEAEMEDAEKAVLDWNNNGVPRDVQQAYVSLFWRSCSGKIHSTCSVL